MLFRVIAFLIFATNAYGTSANGLQASGMAGPAESYISEPLPDCRSHKLGYWGLNESGGATRVNTLGSLGSAADLTVSGTVSQNTGWFVESPASNAVVSGITPNYLTCASCTGLDVTTSLSWSCSIKMTSLSSGSSLIGRGITATDGWMLHTTSNGSCYVDGNQASATTNINNGQEHYVTCRYNGSTVRISVDGVQEASTAATSMTSSSAAFSIFGQDMLAYTGSLDNCSVTTGSISDASDCWDCSCLPSGELCRKHSKTLVSEGRRVTNCHSCTMPTDVSVCPY